MYNIKEAASRAGVTVPVLRAWERRYGIVSPARSASGYRRFDDAGVARIRTMRGLVGDGWSPSAAAAAILSGQVPVTQDRVAAAASSGTPAQSMGAGDGVQALGERFLNAARALDGPSLEAVLDELFTRGSFEHVATTALFPILQRLGDAWSSGDIDVAGEHFASAAVLRRLGIAMDAAGAAVAGRGRPSVVIGLPSGGRHEIGALAFAIAARRAGMGVTYIGADLPAADWVRAASDADAAAIGVVTARDRRSALDTAAALRAARPDLVIAFGGRAAPAVPGVLALPEPLTESVAAISAAVDARPS
jgi:methylmalonyl-CoA mutase cobalamin-binding subunit